MNRAYQLHILLQTNNNNKIETLLETLDLNNITDNGLMSNLIIYFIKNNDSRINILLNNKIKLMKRDYLMLCNYYYNSNYSTSLKMFNDYIVGKEVLTKDIDYIIENKMYKLLALLNGIYIKSNINNMPLYTHNIGNNIIDMSIIDNIIVHISSHISKSYLDEFNIVISKQCYNHIIDGCNVILYKGQITKKNLLNLYKISNNKNSLLIIHKRHIKKYPEIKFELDKLNIKYYLTPFNFNDDLFILLAFLNNPHAFIISNDNFRDHIFNYNQNIHDYNQFKNYLKHHTLSFTYDSINKIDTQLDMIYHNNNDIIVPHTSGKYLKLKLEKH